MDIHSLYRLIWNFTRRRRMWDFEQAMGLTDATTVIDVGGYTPNWKYLTCHPRVKLVNVHSQPGELPEQFTQAVADGCALPYAKHEFDIAFSNSVIEHVGDWSRQQQFAREIRRVGRKVWVQTPYRWTWIEPHYICAFLHWLPLSKPWKVRLLKYLSVRGWTNRSEIAPLVDELRLLNWSEMCELFPDCDVHIERFLCYSSLVACRISRSWLVRVRVRRVRSRVRVRVRRVRSRRMMVMMIVWLFRGGREAR